VKAFAKQGRHFINAMDVAYFLKEWDTLSSVAIALIQSVILHILPSPSEAALWVRGRFEFILAAG